MTPTTLIFAHRGASHSAPENTLTAFKEAVLVGSEGIELDVHLSLDKALIVIHDETVNRTTTHQGQIQKMTLAEIKACDAGSKKSSIFKGEPIPTLDEVVALLCQENFTGLLNIELKTDVIHYEGIEALVASLMQKRPLPFRYLYSSFYFPSLVTIHHHDKNAEKAFLFETKQELEKIVEAENLDFISALHPKYSTFSNHQAWLKSFNKPLRLWTVNKEKEMRDVFTEGSTKGFMRGGVSGIFTDFPKEALALRESLRSLTV